MFFFSADLYAACGGTVITWDGGNNGKWSDKRSWVGDTNIAETVDDDALIISAAKNCILNASYSIGCFENDAGVMVHDADMSLTINGDYYKNLTPNSYSAVVGQNCPIVMAGTAPQTFENVDPINNLIISNETSVTLTHGFEIRNELTLSGSTTNLLINADITISEATFEFVIPAGVTVELAAGATLKVAGNLTINGNLRINAGSSVILGNGKMLYVGASGELRMNGASGNVATLKGDSDYINTTIDGSLYANYFRFERVGLDGRGVYVPGLITKMDSGDFLYINSASYGLTLDSSSSVPTIMDNIGFFDNAAFGNNFNIDASNYNGSDITIDHWAGIAGDTYENDPNNKIFWNANAETVILLSTNNHVGAPTDPIIAGSVAEEFSILSFSLNKIDTASDITSINLSLNGTAFAYDVDFIQVFHQGADCQTKGAQIGGTYTLSGDPGMVTVAIPAGELTISDTTSKCIHVFMQTTASAANNATIGIGIAGTEDVVNSQAYSFSTSSGPPVYGPTVTISGDPTNSWTGRKDGTWNSNQLNWSNAFIPTTTDNCKIVLGETILALDGDYGCMSMTFTGGGAINWSSGAHILSVFGTLIIGENYDFQNATLGVFSMSGSSNQGISAATAIPNDLVINNSGGITSVVTINDNITVNGNVLITSGTLSIPNGSTLTVLGNITVSSGAALDIEGGGTLVLSNGSSLTVDAGAIIELVGDSNNSTITSTGAADSYAITVNGTIKANGYTLDHMDINGLVINSSATIDATNFLQNGTFHSPVANNSVFLKLFKAIPGNALSGMGFSLNGSLVTGVVNIYTDASIGAGTLNLSSYSGDLSGDTFDNDNTYLLSWSGLLNTINIAAQSSPIASAYQGQTYNMGSFSFMQELAGESYIDTDISTFILTLSGTGSANDVDLVKIFYDSACSGTGGVQVGGDQVFSGNPARVTFSTLTGATIPADITTPPQVCMYVTFDIASDAVNGQTVGVELNRIDHFSTVDSYAVSGSTTLPIDLGHSIIIGSSTIWTGTNSSDWFDAGNWNGGIPNSTLNCFINNANNNPAIGSGTGICNSIEIGGGATLSINSGATLQLYGSIENFGTFANSGTLEFTDDGSNSKNQSIGGITALNTLTVSKTAGGTIFLGSTNFSIATINMNGSGYDFIVNNTETLSVTTALNINGGNFIIAGGGNLEMSGGSTISVAGGLFKIDGTHDMYPQSITNKGRVYGAGGANWAFNATSGSVYLKGFLIDDIDTNGVVLGGSASLDYLGGGQLRNLSTSYSSVKGFQLNTSGSLPATASDIGWNWSPNNAFPGALDGYNLVTSSGCASQSIEFVEFFGDWFDTIDVNPEDKTTTTNCNVTYGLTQSAVALTEFFATAYNSAVDLRWTTGLETNHFGFNVYRSEAEGKNYIQLNENIIMNLLNSATMQGHYQFLDLTALNGVTYFYYIEDVEWSGTMRSHGPQIATPLDGLGNSYADTVDVNSGTRSSSVSTNPLASVIENSGYRDLGDGVVILSKTSSLIRLRITPGVASFSDSSWDANYKHVVINGYQQLTVAGNPELLEKNILIEVDSDITMSELASSTISKSDISGKLIVPAPSWISDGGDGLIANYGTPNSDIYGVDALWDEEYFYLFPDIVVIGSKKFIKIRVKPLSHNPVQSLVTRVDELILEIGLNGRDLGIVAPTVEISPYNAANTLKIFITQTGVYEFSFDELVESHVSYPFVGASIADLRLYFTGSELAMEVSSIDEIFNSGDTIRFFAKYFDPQEDIKRTLILSTEDLLVSGSAPKRFETIDGNPSGIDDSFQHNFYNTAVAEQNNIELMDAPLGFGEDHFYWAMLISNIALDGYSNAPLNTTLNLESIDYDSTEDAVVKIYMKGRQGINVNLTHHVGLYLNNMSTLAASQIFVGDEIRVVEFKIPVDQLIDGLNNIKVAALATEVPVSDYDMLYINKIEIKYPIHKVVTNDKILFRNQDRDSTTAINGFSSSNINVFDISTDPISYVINAELSFENYLDENGDTQTRHQIEFNTSSISGGSFEYYVFENSTVLAPVAFELNHGFNSSLLSNDNEADYLLIGHQDLLNVASELIALRESQGLQAKAIDLQQIYNEFSNGVRSSYAIKNFINHTLEFWQVKPKYILLLGDGTYDPKNILQYGINQNNFPIPLVKGLLYDVGSDNWFGSSYESSLPQVAIGRIPTSDPEKLFYYIEKLIGYETGALAPNVSDKKEMTFVAGESYANTNEQFSERTRELGNLSALVNNKFSSTFLDVEEDIDGNFNNAQVKANLLSAFNSEQFMISYYGHGAEDMWGEIINNNDIASLNNNKLPIVMTLNCLNTAFFYPDPDHQSIGELMMLKEHGGAIAFIGSGAMTMPQAQMNFALNLYQELGESAGDSNQNIRLGDLVLKSKIMTGDSIYQQDVNNSYALLGDPAMKLPPEFFAELRIASVAADIPSSISTGGCSAFAGEGQAPSTAEGILEFLFLILLTISLRLGLRRLS